MTTSVTLEADGDGEIISSFLPHACPQLSHSQVMSLRLSPTMYTGEPSYPLQILPVLHAATDQPLSARTVKDSSAASSMTALAT